MTTSTAQPSMLADRMLGKLARMLRMVGHDVEYVREGESVAIGEQAAREGRVLLTRDRKMAARAPGAVTLVTSNYPFHQARQVIRELSLAVADDFPRCVEDNGELARVPGAEVMDEVPPAVRDPEREFFRCDRCRKVFWDGAHVRAMREVIAALQDAPLVAVHEENETKSELVELEPLVDLHQAMEVLLLRHRLALMNADAREAAKVFRRFSMCLVRHIQDERELVLPIYAGAPPPGGHPRGASPDIFENEHEKILGHLNRLGAATEALTELEPGSDVLRVECLHLLDREKIFVDLLEHHDHREREWLYPALERTLSEPEKLDLLERMVGPAAGFEEKS